MPLVYLFITIFFLRGQVEFVYLSSLVLVALTVYVARGRKLQPVKLLAYWMVVLASLGISASVILSIEKVELLISPDHVTSCSLSPIVACSPVIMSEQSSAFGFPNPFIGIFGFAAVLTAGMTILAGADKLAKAWWRTLMGGITFGAVFCGWLFYQGVFNIGKLCLYCMLVWLVTMALFWLVLAFNIKRNNLNLGKTLNKLADHQFDAIFVTYLIIALAILFRWSEYWHSLLP